MTNMEKLGELYARKRAEGLIDVKFAWNDSAKGATAEELAGDILKMQEAIDAGKTTPLDFGDLRWKMADGNEVVSFGDSHKQQQ